MTDEVLPTVSRGVDRWFTVAGLGLIVAGTVFPFFGADGVDVSKVSLARILSEGLHQGVPYVAFVALAVTGATFALVGRYQVALLFTGLVAGMAVATVTIASGLFKWFEYEVMPLFGPEAEVAVAGGLGSGALVMLIGAALACYGALASVFIRA